MRVRPRLLTAALGAIAILAVPASAQAVERFASPTGAPSANCLDTAPCDIQSAIEGVSALDVDDGDVVTLLPGNYTAGSAAADRVTPSDDIEIRGQPGQPRPTLTSSSVDGGVFLATSGITLRRLEIVHAAANDPDAALTVAAAGILVEEVVARSLTTGSINAQACEIVAQTGASIVVRDTACFSSNSNFATDVAGSGTPSPVVLTNVTTVAAVGNGLAANGASIDVTATNVIASGGTDVNVQNNAEITLDHSNYDTVTQLTGGDATDVGENATNQQMAAVFVGLTDFHQAANSPTINGGTATAPNLGSTDFDGAPRNQGSAPDIGADEVDVDSDGDGVLDVNDTCPTQAGPASTGGCPDTDGDGIPDATDTCPTQAAPGTADGCPVVNPPPPDTDKPQTTINKGAKGEVETDTVTFKFKSDEQGSTFECRLVELGGGKGGRKAPKFKRCTSPRKLKNLDPGEYRFEVRATDAAGNTDSTAAKRKFEIVEKEKGR